ncbi:MAG: magnesium transporter, partial [Vagococcus sp.]
GDLTIGDTLKKIKEIGPRTEVIETIFVINQNKQLVGTADLRDILIGKEETKLVDIINDNILAVHPEVDQEEVSRLVSKYDLKVIPVVNRKNNILGIITVDDIIDVIDDEATSDYSGLAGVDVEATAETPLKASIKRLPWLITLLFLGMSTATLISHYELLINEASILAVFISLITGTAGNAGTQSLAVAVRKLAISDDKDNNFFKLVINEVLTGLITGLVTGVVIFVVVGFWKHNFVLGFVIGIAMLCAITVANLAGSFIPILMEKIGFDPAVASGPFITTLSDLTSVLIYFNIARLFMGFLIEM